MVYCQMLKLFLVEFRKASSWTYALQYFHQRSPIADHVTLCFGYADNYEVIAANPVILQIDAHRI